MYYRGHWKANFIQNFNYNITSAKLTAYHIQNTNMISHNTYFSKFWKGGYCFHSLENRHRKANFPLDKSQRQVANAAIILGARKLFLFPYRSAEQGSENEQPEVTSEGHSGGS